MPKKFSPFNNNFEDEFENFTEEDFKYFTIAFVIELLVEETHNELIKGDAYAQLNYYNFKCLPPKERIKYETNTLSKYVRVMEW